MSSPRNRWPSYGLTAASRRPSRPGGHNRKTGKNRPPDRFYPGALLLGGGLGLIADDLGGTAVPAVHPELADNIIPFILNSVEG